MSIEHFMKHHESGGTVITFNKNQWGKKENRGIHFPIEDTWSCVNEQEVNVTREQLFDSIIVSILPPPGRVEPFVSHYTADRMENVDWAAYCNVHNLSGNLRRTWTHTDPHMLEWRAGKVSRTPQLLPLVTLRGERAGERAEDEVAAERRQLVVKGK